MTGELPKRVGGCSNRQIDTCLKTVSMDLKIKSLKQRESKVDVRQNKRTRSETESATLRRAESKQLISCGRMGQQGRERVAQDASGHVRVFNA